MNGCVIVCTFLSRRLDDCDIGEDLIQKGMDYYYYLNIDSREEDQGHFSLPGKPSL